MTEFEAPNVTVGRGAGAVNVAGNVDVAVVWGLSVEAEGIEPEVVIGGECVGSLVEVTEGGGVMGIGAVTVVSVDGPPVTEVVGIGVEMEVWGWDVGDGAAEASMIN